jgi:small-conductance mechanosensitive channel
MKVKRDGAVRKTFRFFQLIPIILMAVFICPSSAHSSFWNFFQGEEKKQPSKPSEGIIRESRERPATPLKLGMEIQSVSNELEYYRKEIEFKKREKEEIARQISSKPRTDLNREIEKIELDVRGKQQVVKDLERELLGLKKRLRVFYLSYVYRLLLVLAVFAGAYLLNRAARTFLRRMSLEESRRQGAERLIRILLFISASVVAVFIGLENLAHVAAVLGLALAGSAIALKDVFTSLIGWLMLIFTRQIRVGDFIESGGISGKVLEISTLKTTVLEYKNHQETGRVIYLANNLIFSQAVYNSGHAYVWDNINLYLTHQSDWKTGYHLLLELLDGRKIESLPKAESNPGALAEANTQRELKPVVHTSIEDKGILLSVRYPAPVQSLLNTRSDVMQAILNAFSKEKNLVFA